MAQNEPAGWSGLAILAAGLLGTLNGIAYEEPAGYNHPAGEDR